MSIGTEPQTMTTEIGVVVEAAVQPRIRLFAPVASRSFLALADQAVVSGVRFLTTILVARACGPAELGLYCLGFTIVMLATSVQESLISLPYTIFGSRLKDAQRRIYAGNALLRCLVLAALVSGGLALAAQWSAAGLGPAGLAPVLRALTVAVPFMFLVEFARRFCFAHLRMGAALVLDMGVALLGLGALSAVFWSHSLSAATGYLAIAAASAAATVLWYAASRDRFHVVPGRIGESLGRDWRFGRWVFASQFAAAVHGNIVPWLLAFMLSTTATGLFAACATIVALANPLLLGIGNLLTPSVASAFAEEGKCKVRRVVLTATAVLGVAVIVLGAMMILFGDDLLRLFFGSSYAGQQATLAILVLAMIAEAVGLPAYNGLWALERPTANFFSMAAGLAVTVAVASLLVMSYGSLGAACGVLAGRAIASLFQGVAFLRFSATVPPGDGGPP